MTAVQARFALPAYTAGTVSGNSGQAVVTGSGTSWMTQDANGNSVSTVVGGDLFITATYPIPIKSVDSATQITLEQPLPSTINAGSSYRILKITPNQTGALTQSVLALMQQGTDAVPDLSRTIDSGAARVKLRIGADGNPQLAFGPTNAADAALVVGLEFLPSGAVLFPQGTKTPTAMGKNKVRNGDFRINGPKPGFPNGYTSGSTLAANGPAHSGWRDYGGGGAAYTFSQGVADTTINITAGQICQFIEGANIEGGTYCLSWAGTAKFNLYFTPPGGSNTGVGGLTSGALQSIPAGSVVQLQTASGGGTLGDVQFELSGANGVPTNFERRPLATETLLCEYYSRTVSTSLRYTNPVAVSTGYDGTVTFPSMRTSPTISLITAAATRNNLSSNSPPALSPLSANSARLEITAAASASDTYSIGDLWYLSAEL